jgi:branched-chain amino acid transport system substrate-binding protein
MTPELSEPEEGLSSGLTRRSLLRKAGSVGVLLGAGSIAAACGSSSSSQGSSTTPAVSDSNAVGRQIRHLLGTPTGKAAGAGLTIPVGVVTALTGEGAQYGVDHRNGTALAAAHIKAAGGPTFKFTFYDNGSGNPQDGVEAMRRLGIAGVPVCLTAYGADVGAMLPGIKQYKLLTFDGAGGNLFGVEPYFYGAKARTFVDQIAGVLKYVKTANPNAKHVVNVGWDQGAQTNAEIAKTCSAAAAANGMTAAPTILTQIPQTDYTNEIAKLTQANPDAVVLSLYTNDTAYFMKQYATSSLKAPVFCAGDFVPSALEIAGPAFNGYHFAFDYFDAAAPDNNWSKLFASDYQKQFGSSPIYQSANMYEDTFMLWQMVREAVAKNLDTSKNATYVTVFNNNPHFKSVYGGSGDTLGALDISFSNNSPSRRSQGVYVVKGTSIDSIKRLATFDIAGADFKLA